MNAAAYHHYALDYDLLAAIMLGLFLVLVVVAVLDGRRRRRRSPDGHPREQPMARPAGK